MSSQATPDETFSADNAKDLSFGDDIRKTLKPLASLKLTVTLFGFSIFLILAGTWFLGERRPLFASMVPAIARMLKPFWSVVPHALHASPARRLGLDATFRS